MRICHLFIGCGLLYLSLAHAMAQVTEFKINQIQPFADGHSFGEYGHYEVISGVFSGELNPQDAHNTVIVNLPLAPKNQRGKVEYSADFTILRPANAEKSSQILLYDVPNRGRKFALHWVLDAPAQDNAAINHPQSLQDAGNGLFMRRGYTLVWSGWEPLKKEGLLNLNVPIARNSDGSAIIQTIRDEVRIGSRTKNNTNISLSYPSASVNNVDAELRIKEDNSTKFTILPASSWRFSDQNTLVLLPEGSTFKQGALYEVRYPAKDPTVSGIGFAATRDLVSYLRQAANNPQAPAELRGRDIKHSLAIGISQSGRYLRDFITLGFNQDENGKRVFDGVLSHIAGAGGVFLNEPFSQSGRTLTAEEDRFYPEIAPPFSVVKDAKGLSRLKDDGFDPLWMEVNTSSEYWQKSAALLHTSRDGKRDLTLPANYRVYMAAGTQHGGRVGLSSDLGPAQAKRNPHNPSALVRALIVALENWVLDGRQPPESRVPTLANKDLVSAKQLKFPPLPNFLTPVACNDYLPFGDWRNPQPEAKAAISCLISQVNSDGNETGGVLLPDIAVPLATYTGWNLYRAPLPVNRLADRDGAYLLLALTEKQQQVSGDPRPSIETRYKNHQEYVKQVRTVSNDLVKGGYLLAEDALAYVNTAQSMEAQWLFSAVSH